MENAMYTVYEKALYSAAERFKKYQKRVFPEMTESNDNGEWVFGCEFDEMCRACLAIIKNVPASYAGDGLIETMPYAIARDNECSYLIKEILHAPEGFAVLCRYSLKTDYQNAIWQFAEQLKDYNG